MKCRICLEEFVQPAKRRVTCGDKCKEENRIRNKVNRNYMAKSYDTQGPSIVFKNLFILGLIAKTYHHH